MHSNHKRYEICLKGCDDDTTFEMILSDNEAKTIKMICEASVQCSTYGCQPIMEMKEVK